MRLGRAPAVPTQGHSSTAGTHLPTASFQGALALLGWSPAGSGAWCHHEPCGAVKRGPDQWSVVRGPKARQHDHPRSSLRPCFYPTAFRCTCRVHTGGDLFQSATVSCISPSLGFPRAGLPLSPHAGGLLTQASLTKSQPFQFFGQSACPAAVCQRTWAACGGHLGRRPQGSQVRLQSCEGWRGC